MNIKLLPMAVLAGCLSLTHVAMAQQPVSDLSGHLSHRYLPPPQGKKSLNEQVGALQELRKTMGDEEQWSAPLALSPAQLKQLDTILDSFRDEKGELNIPSPESVPKQWIESLMPDPQQRQQVKDVLEEYARSRNLQLDTDSNSARSLPPLESLESPKSNSTSPRTTPQLNSSPNSNPNSNPNNTLNGNPSSNPSSELSRNPNRNRPSNNLRDSQRPNSNRPANNPPANDRFDSNRENNFDATGDGIPGPGEAGQPELPTDKLADLQKLYETLQQIQQQRAQQELSREAIARQQQRSSQSERDRMAAGPARNAPPVRRPARTSETSKTSPKTSPGTLGNNLRDRTDRNPGSNSPRTGNTAPDLAQSGNLQSTPLPSPSTGNDLASETGATRGLGGNDADASNASGQPSNSSTPKANQSPPLTPFDEGYDFTADQKLALDPFAPSKDATSDGNLQGNIPKKFAPSSKPAEQFNVTKMAQEPRSRPELPEMNAGDQGFDLKKSIHELGLGPALKRIVQKTLAEQGYDPARPGNPSAFPNSTANNAAASPNMSGSNMLDSNMPGASTTEQLKTWANSMANSPRVSTSSPSSNTSSSRSSSEWGAWMNEVWKAVAEVPAAARSARSSTGSSSPSSPSGANMASSPGVASQLLDVRWSNNMTMALLAVAGLILLLVWMSRRRVAELADASAAQAEWVRTVMAQGLKTRADVVRAFHQLVKQSRAVSDWWTHRSIVKHFNSQTPQVAAAINELAIVYEQARYYPEDVELSQQQLTQVRTLLESVKIPTSNHA